MKCNKNAAGFFAALNVCMNLIFCAEVEEPERGTGNVI